MLVLGTGGKSPASVCISFFGRNFIYSSTHNLCTGSLFLNRLKKALVMELRHGQAFADFNATFPPAAVAKWDKMVADWDRDKSKKNPYEVPVAGKLFHSQFDACCNLPTHVGTTMTDVRLELAKEENEDAMRGAESLHEVSAGKWLAIGLDLEEQQYVS